MGITMKCGSWPFYHNYHRFTDAGTGNSWHLRPSFYEHLYTSLSCALVVLCCAHIRATVFWPCNQDLNIELNTLINIQRQMIPKTATAWLQTAHNLHDSTGIGRHRAAQHRSAVVVQSVPSHRGSWLSSGLAFEIDGIADPDSHRSCRGHYSLRRF